MKSAYIRIDLQLLRDVLHLPADVEIDRIQTAFDCFGVAEIRLTGERFANVPLGNQIPKVEAIYQTVDGKPRFVGFK